MFLKIFGKGLRKIFSLVPFLLIFFAINTYAQVYLDSTATVDERVEDLISRMTLEEKVGQMTQIDLSHVKDNLQVVSQYYLGSILSGGGSTPGANTTQAWANMYDLLQQSALSTRLKIPIIYGIDAVHGHNNLKDAVIFPHNIGLGATRNAELVEEIGRITALEVAATAIDWTFAPCIAVPQDERWGRTYEGFAETPELTRLLGTAYIKGLQGDTLADKKSILACAKHFLGDGGTTKGDDQGNTEIDETALREIHLPAYIDAINSGVGSIMATYNSWNGQKVHGSYYLLTTVLKEELGFEGFIVSDWAAIDQLPGDYKSDIKNSINAGIDMVMVPDRYDTFITDLLSLVNSGDVNTIRIDDAVRRILKIKFKLGLFEKPYSDLSLVNSVGTEDHRAIARQAVRESLTLLKKKDGVFPLSKTNEKIFVAGTGADNIGMQCGGWTISWQGLMGDITKGTTILEGVQKLAGNTNVYYSQSGETDESFDKAIIVIGEEPYAEGEGDRSDLTISNSDIELVKRVYAKGKPTIVILLSGRPMIINPILHYTDAIFAAWLPGSDADGIAEVLFGDYQPVAKLGHSWAKYMEQIPINIGDENYDPLFEYGFGFTSLNDSENGSQPQIYSALLSADSKTLELAFNKNIDPVSLSACNFLLKVDGEENSFTALPVINESNHKFITVPLTVEVNKNQKLSLSFLSGTIKSEDGGTLDIFEDEFVYNGKNNALVPITLPGKIEAENYFDMFGVQTESTSDIGGGVNVGWIDTDDWLSYYVSFGQRGTYKLDYRIAAESQNGIITLFDDDKIIKSTFLPVTTGWQNWQTQSTEVVMEEGEYFIKLLADIGGFNLNWFSFDLISGIEDENIINEFTLRQNYPNPFNPATVISFSIPHRSKVILKIFDVLGNEISELVSETKPAGTYSVNFDGTGLASGVYYYRLIAGEYNEAKKLMILK